MSANNASRVETKKQPIEFSRFFLNDFQKEGSKTAEIKQKVETKSYYPSKKIDSNFQDNLFTEEEFGYGEQEFKSTETRVAWLIVPNNTSEEVFNTKLKAATDKGATIYRVLSNKPILDENQLYGIKQGLRTMDDYANSQAVRIPENNDTLANGTAGKLLLDGNGKVTYRRTFFSTVAKEDMDLRNTTDSYLSPELEAEIMGASIFASQTI